MMYSFDTAGLSKYRQILMGFGTINVLVLHAIAWGEYNCMFSKLLGWINCLVFTWGFILVSGLGCYYSYKNDSSVLIFYKKRIKRVFIPFVIMSLPFYLYYFIKGDANLMQFILHITAFDYFVYGNGMWYISTSMLLYLLFPSIYAIIFSYSNSKIGFSIAFTSICIMIIVLSYVSPHYFMKTSTAWVVFPVFTVGIYLGFLAYNHTKIKLRIILALFLLLAMSAFFRSKHLIIEWLFNLNLRLCAFWLICIVLPFIEGKCIYKILNWVGKYTLEIYVIHLLFYFLLIELLHTHNITIPMSYVIFIVWLFAFSSAPLTHKLIEFVIKK